MPLTTSVGRLYPSEAYVTIRGKRHKAMADQLTTAAKKRLQNRVGRLSLADLRSVGEILKLQLALMP